MTGHLTISLRITAVLVVLTCVLYPAAVWAVGQLAFRDEANGSFVTRGGKVVGSELIGQRFTSDRFFHPRPSAATYDATASGGTNLGPTSKQLLAQVDARVAAYADVRPPGGIAADAVTASASGLDPHITPANALAQAPRVARANGIAQAEIERLIRARTEGRFIGVYGEPRVNVLLLNLDVQSLAAHGAGRP